MGKVEVAVVEVAVIYPTTGEDVEPAGVPPLPDMPREEVAVHELIEPFVKSTEPFTGLLPT